MINQHNFNNPENLQLSNSYGVISATLDNPYVAKPIEYGDFRSADPVLNSMLPKLLNLGHNDGNANNGNDITSPNHNVNLGLTSPGTVTKSMECSGLDYIDTNTNYDKLPFQVCLNKFNKQYRIPEMAFNNLINDLPYTFSAVQEEEKERYLSSLQGFIDKESIKNGIHLNKHHNNHNNHNNQPDNDDDNSHKNTHIDSFKNIKEHFGDKKPKCSGSGLSLSGILTIVIIIIIIIVFVLFIANKN
jgi:hypothetical protein